MDALHGCVQRLKDIPGTPITRISSAIQDGCWRGWSYLHVFKSGGTHAQKVLNVTTSPRQSSGPILTFVRNPFEHFMSGYYEVMSGKVIQNTTEFDRMIWRIAGDDGLSTQGKLKAVLKFVGIHPRTTKRFGRLQKQINAHMQPQTWYFMGAHQTLKPNVREVFDLDSMDTVLGRRSSNRANDFNSSQSKHRFFVDPATMDASLISSICSFVYHDYCCLGFAPDDMCNVIQSC